MTKGMLEQALQDLYVERQRQDRKYPPADHEWAAWGTILFSECGEAMQEIRELTFLHPDYEHGRAGIEKRLREELVQVGAVAVAMIQQIDARTQKREIETALAEMSR